MGFADKTADNKPVRWVQTMVREAHQRTWCIWPCIYCACCEKVRVREIRHTGWSGTGIEFVKNVSRSLSTVRMPQSLDNHTRVRPWNRTLD